MYAKELTPTPVVGGLNTLWTVVIPPWLRVFDCREEDAFLGPKGPWGTILFGGEKAEVDLGLRGLDAAGQRFSHSTYPMHCRTYVDSRTCSQEELVRQLTDMVGEARKLYGAWEEAAKYPSNGKGGTGLYMPLAVEISNYGWGIIADRRQYRVRRFGVGA